jgi:hypothetical protein
MKLTRLLFVIGFTSFFLNAKHGFGQSVEIGLVQLYGDEVIVNYKLHDQKGRKFFISLFSSKDNFKTPLTHVTGDVGEGILPGENKKIVWDIKTELGQFKGDLTFEIKCQVMEDFQVKKVIKRGKVYPLRWNPENNLGENVKIELINNAQKTVWEDGNLANTGRYSWKLPVKIKKGKGYSLKLTNTKNTNQTSVSNFFEIKPKTPLAVKIFGFVTVGVASIILKGSKGAAASTALPEFSSIGFPTK